MTRTGLKLVLCFGSLVALYGADAPANESGLADNPYRTIVERNPFGLKPPPPPAPPPQPAADQTKNDLKLTGITSWGSLKAWFTAIDPKDKKVDSFSLGVDEKKDGIEVLAIDDAAKSVRIRSAGVETLMTFATHGVAPPATGPPPPTAAPGMPGAVPGIPTVPGGANIMPVTTGISPAPGSGPGIYTIPSRTLRTQMDPALAARYGLTTAPVSNLPPRPDPPANLPDPAQAVIMMEAQRIINPTLPPTPGLPTTTDMAPPGGSAPGVPAPAIPRFPRLPGQ
ncbi:MAG: hypothetical protein HY735_05915 [Verrucomicrobia bacterium]|nr:hypothetical protein [Verrucomicrobiota bacterium]